MSAAASIGGTAANAIMGAKKRKEERRLLEEKERRNQAWYDRRYNEDATQRADAQRLMTYVQEQVRKRNQAAAGTQAVMGGTEEAAAAAREQNNQALAETASRIAADAADRKDKVEDMYMKRQEAIDDDRSSMMEDERGNIATSTQGLVNAAAAIGNGLDGVGDEVKEIKKNGYAKA